MPVPQTTCGRLVVSPKPGVEFEVPQGRGLRGVPFRLEEEARGGKAQRDTADLRPGDVLRLGDGGPKVRVVVLTPSPEDAEGEPGDDLLDAAAYAQLIEEEGD